MAPLFAIPTVYMFIFLLGMNFLFFLIGVNDHKFVCHQDKFLKSTLLFLHVSQFLFLCRVDLFYSTMSKI